MRRTRARLVTYRLTIAEDARSNGRNRRGSHVLSIPGAFGSILPVASSLSLASSRRSSCWAFVCTSAGLLSFSGLLLPNPLITFRFSSCSNSSVVLGLGLGCLLESPHASSLFPDIAASHLHLLSSSRGFASSSSFLFVSCCRIAALSSLVALTQKLSAASVKAAASLGSRD